ncbi:hypothetical protein ABZ914_02885 [Spirillospora sp. NPDC046719]
MDASDDPPAALDLVVYGPDRAEFGVSQIPADMMVREFAAEFMRDAYGVPGARRFRLIVDVEDPATSELLRLDSGATLHEAGLRDGSRLYVSPEPTAGGFGLPEVASFITGAILSGAVGNAGYDLLRAACRSLGGRWSGRRRLLGRRALRAGDAVEMARAAASIKFSIRDPDRLRLVVARPIRLRYDQSGITSMKVKRLASLRGSARSWSCVFSLEEAGLPASMTVVVQANPPDPERTGVYVVLPDE